MVLIVLFVAVCAGVGGIAYAIITNTRNTRTMKKELEQLRRDERFANNQLQRTLGAIQIAALQAHQPEARSELETIRITLETEVQQHKQLGR